MNQIFGPIQWAFSILPKWEGAWAKWLTRYLTVHFYGAMLYFVGFYVLLLFDIVLCIQNAWPADSSWEHTPSVRPVPIKNRAPFYDNRNDNTYRIRPDAYASPPSEAFLSSRNCHRKA